MSNTLTLDLVTKQNFSSINDIVCDIKISENPIIVVENLLDVESAISELESISINYNIEVFVQIQDEESKLNFEGSSLKVFDSTKDDINDNIRNSDLVISLGNNIERFQNTLIENSINAYQITYRERNIFKEDLFVSNFKQINSDEAGFVKALLIMI
ncbi:MAG: hypothetical protein ABF289_08565 [Clostridiales bacterium]